MDEKSIAHYAVVAVNLDGTYGEIVKRGTTLSDLAHSDIDPGFFPVTFITKDDIRAALGECANCEVPDNIERVISELDEGDMRELASDMADDYVNQLYWSSMEILFNSNFEDRIEDAEDDEEAQFEKDLKRCSD